MLEWVVITLVTLTFTDGSSLTVVGGANKGVPAYETKIECLEHINKFSHRYKERMKRVMRENGKGTLADTQARCIRLKRQFPHAPPKITKKPKIREYTF